MEAIKVVKASNICVLCQIIIYSRHSLFKLKKHCFSIDECLCAKLLFLLEGFFLSRTKSNNIGRALKKMLVVDNVEECNGCQEKIAK